MSRKQPSSNAPSRALSFGAALLAALLLSGATSEDADLLQAARHKIQMMSQSQLNQLKRNYESYLKLPPERREQFARLNDELEQDAKNGARLTKLLDRYNAWLFTLSPFDREKLLGTSDPGERAQLVQKLLQEQQKQRLARASKAPFPLLALRFDGAGASISSSELDVVLNAVKENFLADQAKQRLSPNLGPRERHLQIIRITMDQLRREREAGTNMRERENALVDTILEALPNDRMKTQLTRNGLTQRTRRQLGQILARAILAEWKPELDQAPVTPAQTEATTKNWLAGVSGERRETLQQRLQTENGRKFVATFVALTTNPQLKKQKQPVMWLLRAFPSPPTNRQFRSGGQGGASRGGAAGPSTPAKAANPANDDAEKDSPPTDQ